MGVTGFYPWIKKLGYIPRTTVLPCDARLLVDSKIFMYKFSYGIDSQAEDFAQQIASRVQNLFRNFENVTFVNDGDLPADHLKSKTSERRTQARKAIGEKAQSKKRLIAEIFEEEKWQQDKKTKEEEEQKETSLETSLEKATSLTSQVSPEELEAVEKGLRASRGVKTQVSRDVLNLLQEKHQCIQCEGEEADTYIRKHFSEYDFVLSEDSDLIISGVDVVRDFNGYSGNLYRCADILKVTKFTLKQIQEMACLSGCDYFDGLPGVGLNTAAKIINKWGSVDKIQFNKQEKAKYQIGENFVAEIALACNEFEK
jgi:5'-3' exonuclease